jgi:hypothetical protein
MRVTLRVTGLLWTVFILFPPFSQGFEIRSGNVFGSLDTTVSLGASWRLQDRDEALIGIGNGGTAPSTNRDDGNLNYAPGLIAALANVTHELELNYGAFSAFVRGNYFYDVVNANKDELSPEAQDQVGARARLLDAFVTGSFDPGGTPLEVRIGQQVISWGESTFIPNGIDVINPLNLGRIRSPGVALRDALLPVPAAWISAVLLPQLTVEGFYLFQFEALIVGSATLRFSRWIQRRGRQLH